MSVWSLGLALAYLIISFPSGRVTGPAAGASTSVKRFVTPNDLASTNRVRSRTPDATAGGPRFVLSRSETPATAPAGPSRTSGPIAWFYPIIRPRAVIPNG